MLPADLRAIYERTLERLSGRALVASALAPRARDFQGAAVVALGKAACSMARGAAEVLGPGASGVVASHVAEPLPSSFRLVLGSHPIPDERSEAAARALKAEVDAIAADRPTLFLVSGGGSAIAVAPVNGLSLADKTKTTRALLRSGASIEEVNAVRKHLSAIKGGQLGAACVSERVLTLVLSDVPSNDIGAVASGPTFADATRFEDCLRLVRSRKVELPEAALAYLERGASGLVPETPKPGDPRLERIEHVLLAGPADLARTAASVAAEAGIEARAIETPFTATVEELAAEIGRLATTGSGPRLFCLCGEPSLRVPREAPAGGRMQHLALLLARSLAGKRFSALCAGSDGRDGDTGHAGALVDGRTASRASARAVDLGGAIARFESASVCASLGIALPAFASGTNLCDLILFSMEG